MNVLRRSIRRLVASASRSGPTHVVPIGLSCRVTHQVRSHFGSTTAYPFDWWIAPIDGLTRYLSDPDPERIYGAGRLEELLVDGEARSVVAPEFGFQLFHEFPRQDGRLPIGVVAPGWREHVPEQRAQHIRRMERLLALDRPGRRILFVRDRLDVDGKGAEASAASVAALWNVLTTRWSRADVELLLVNVPCDDRVPRRGVRWADFEDAHDETADGWRGSSASWARALASR